jgi:putative tricarboxylic transport membrane protein
MPRYVGEIVTAATISLIAGYFFWISASLPAGGGLFPQFAMTCTILLAAYWAVAAFVRRREPGRSERIDFRPTYETLKPLIAVVATVAYVVLMFVVGFFVTTALYVVAISLILGVRNWRLVGATLIVVMPLIYLFFVTFLGARLPAGFAI